MTIGVDRKAVSFNKAICAKMGIGRSSKKCGTLKLHSSTLIRHIVPGRYHITGRDGAFWLTGIKYNEE